MECKITQATSPDEAARLYSDVIDYFDAHINYTAWAHNFYPTYETAADGVRDGTLFEARINGKLAGAIVLNYYVPTPYSTVQFEFKPERAEDVLLVHTLAVHPDFRRDGIARQMMQFAELRARELGAGAIWLDTANTNTPAIALYESLGYIERGRIILRPNMPTIDFWHVYEKIL